jgi:hypothetical protein
LPNESIAYLQSWIIPVIRQPVQNINLVTDILRDMVVMLRGRWTKDLFFSHGDIQRIHFFFRSFFLLFFSLMLVVLGTVSVPCKNVGQFHERDLLCGLGDKTVLSVYVHLPPTGNINEIFFR